MISFHGSWEFLCCLSFTPAILVHRWLPGSRSLKKSVHLSLQGVALASGIFGIWTKFHGEDGLVANFYSLHSWMGLICMLLFGAQVLSWFPLTSSHFYSLFIIIVAAVVIIILLCLKKLFVSVLLVFLTKNHYEGDFITTLHRHFFLSVWRRNHTCIISLVKPISSWWLRK